MHDDLQLQKTGEALLLLLREPESSLCLYRRAGVPWWTCCSTALAEETKGHFLRHFWDQGLCSNLMWALFIIFRGCWFSVMPFWLKPIGMRLSSCWMEEQQLLLPNQAQTVAGWLSYRTKLSSTSKCFLPPVCVTAPSSVGSKEGSS